MMRYLICSAILFCLACSSDYKGLQRFSPACDVTLVKPKEMTTNWFTASVDVMGRHLSGLLLIKNVSINNYRIVFTNEAGLTYFDLEFGRDAGFRVHRIIKQLNRKAIISLLRDDFGLLLGIPFRQGKLNVLSMENEIFAGVKQKSETAYFITDAECASLRRLEIGSDRKRKVTITFKGLPADPDQIQIRHHTFDMVIDLKKVNKE